MADTEQAKKEAEQLSSLIDDLEADLQGAIVSVHEIIQIARRSKHFKGLGQRVQSYTLGHLEAWLEDDRQTGSIPSLREELIDSIEELEDLDIDDDPSLSNDDLELSESFFEEEEEE